MIESLRRIMWALEKKPSVVKFDDVRRAIEQTIGQDIRTIKKYLDLLVRYNCLKKLGRWYFRKVDADTG